MEGAGLFSPADAHDGYKAGMVFKAGPVGLGYYRDHDSSAPPCMLPLAALLGTETVDSGDAVGIDGGQAISAGGLAAMSSYPARLRMSKRRRDPKPAAIVSFNPNHCSGLESLLEDDASTMDPIQNSVRFLVVQTLSDLLTPCLDACLTPSVRRIIRLTLVAAW